ncbi:MAG: zinc and cadmium transporter [Candidatus Azotimanducaceae bacterium]|jgi:zinc and cadmium transporter
MVNALIAAFCIALLSLAGVFLFGKNGKLIGGHRFVIPVAVGVFLGVVFFELIPETLEEAGELGSFAILGGFLAFYMLSHFLRTYHHNNCQDDDDCSIKSRASMLLAGDAVHNIADGVVIASAFLINPAVGIATTIGIALHEIPQEIAEYGLLIKSGYSRKQALTYNFLTASSIFIGVILTSVFSEILNGGVWILTGIAAGNLLYIVASDLIPELNDHRHEGHFTQTFISTLVGLALIIILLEVSH